MAFSFQPKTAGIDGLVLCLDAANTKSYPGSGTTWIDLSQTAITGSLTNGPTFSSVNGGGIIFDGTNDYVEVGNNLNSYVNVSKSLSIESVVTIISSSNSNTIVATGWDTAGFNFRKLTTNGIRFIYLQDGNKYCGYDSSVLSSGTYHITATFGGSNVNNTGSYNLYVNGILNNSSSIQSGTIVSVEPSRSFSIGSILDSLSGRQGYYSGSIHSVKLYNRALSATEVLQNYNAICGRFGKTPTITDGDALSFVNAANISNETQQSAINTLVTDLKGAGLWTKMKAIYPFIGGTAASHKWNLKDPRDADAAFRLTFSGGWTHSSTGADPNGTNAYADTYFIANSNLSLYDGHLSYYARENITVTGTTQALIGVGSNSGGWNGKEAWFIEFASTNANYSHHSTSPTTDRCYVTPTISMQGYSIGTRRTSDPTTLKFFKNNTLLSTASTSVAGQALNIYSVYIGAFNNRTTGAPYASNFTSNECSFATIGNGLTDADAANLYTIVQKYQTTLGRQV